MDLGFEVGESSTSPGFAAIAMQALIALESP